MDNLVNEASALQKPNNKIMSLQFVRAIACAGIMFTHLGLLQVSFSTWSVSAFFVLSGFLMTYNYYTKTVPTEIKGSLLFSIHKIAKLYPFYIIMTVAALPFVFISLLGNFNIRSLLSKVICLGLNVTLLQAWVPNQKVFYFANGVSWYLSVSLFLYFMFPFVLKAIKKIKSKTTAIISIVAIFLLQIILGYLASVITPPDIISNDFTKWAVYICPLFRLGDFVSGALLGYLFLKRKAVVNKLLATVCEIASLALSIAVILIYEFKFACPESTWYGYSLIFLPISLIIVYVFALNSGLISKVMQNKAVLWFGNMSAFIFLCHQVIFNYVSQIVVRLPISSQYNKWIIALITLIITIIGVLIYSKIESAWKKHTRDKKKAGS